MALPLVLKDGFACGPDLMRIVDNHPAPATHERRRRPRLALAWTVYILRGSDERPVESRTKNISSDGLYLYLSEPVSPGEPLRCIIRIPSPGQPGNRRSLSLDCKVRVVRVEKDSSSNTFGIACRIEDYTVIGGEIVASA